MSAEWDAWAMEQNRKPGQHADYRLTGGVRDPYYSSSEYLNSPDSGYAAPTEDYSMLWQSTSPDALSYGKEGKWNPLTEEALLGDQDLLNKFYQGVNTPAAAQPGFTTFNAGLSQETKDAIAAMGGSSHNVANEVTGGQPELDRLLGTMFQPKPAV